MNAVILNHRKTSNNDYFMERAVQQTAVNKGIPTFIQAHVSPECFVTRTYHHSFGLSSNHATRHKTKVRLVE